MSPVEHLTMSVQVRSTRAIAAWFRKKVKPFLSNEVPDKVKEFDRDLAKLEERERSLDEPLSVCFVGGAGVGKSTLINAMAAGSGVIVPNHLGAGRGNPAKTAWRLLATHGAPHPKTITTAVTDSVSSTVTLAELATLVTANAASAPAPDRRR
jgi:predicted GTPase